MKSYLFSLRISAWLVILVVAFGLTAKADTNEVPVEANSPAETHPKPPKEQDSVAVTVNGVAITKSSIEEQIKPQLKQMAAQGTQVPPAFIEQYKKQLIQQALERMIVELLMDEKVKAANIVVTEEEVSEQIKEMASAQRPPLSLEDFKALIEAYGKSFDEVKQRIQRGIGYQKLMEAQWADKINVTEDDARKYYSENKSQFETPEQVKASHILIKPDTTDPNADPNEAKAKAQELLKQIKDGADFATLAKANSADTGSAARGGDLGLFASGQMVPAFEKTAFELKIGQVSDVVETRFGYHIIKLTDRKDAGITAFEQAKDDILKKLTQNRQRELAVEYIESLKTQADIVYLDPALRGPQTPPADKQPKSSNATTACPAKDKDVPASPEEAAEPEGKTPAK